MKVTRSNLGPDQPEHGARGCRDRAELLRCSSYHRDPCVERIAGLIDRELGAGLFHQKAGSEQQFRYHVFRRRLVVMGHDATNARTCEEVDNQLSVASALRPIAVIRQPSGFPHEWSFAGAAANPESGRSFNLAFWTSWSQAKGQHSSVEHGK